MKIKVSFLIDEYYVADALHEVASIIDNSPAYIEKDYVGDHYNAKLEIIEED